MYKVKIEHYKILTLLHIQIRKKYRDKKKESWDTDFSQDSKSGGYLLSHNKCTTIGVAELNDPVRNGKGWDLSAITTLI